MWTEFKWLRLGTDGGTTANAIINIGFEFLTALVMKRIIICEYSAM
jgi:hypothetical protein